MKPDVLFSLSSGFAMFGWLYLIFGGRWTPRVFTIVRVGVPLALSVLYVVALGIAAPDWEGGFGSIEEVRILFGNDWALLAGWVHYLAFDFFVGCWILSQSVKRGLSHVLVVPVLAATFLFGPAGYLLFRVAEAGLPRRSSRIES